jgi:hypothetical protein
VCVCARVSVFVRASLSVCVRVRVQRVCEQACACASRLHAPGHRGGINSSARAARRRPRWMPPAGLARVGRRFLLDEPHGQGAVGWPRRAHVRRRRRRRHLRHRRRRQHRLPPGRVGEHRRRCAAGLGQGGGWVVLRGVLAGVLAGVLRGYHRGTEEYSRGCQGVLMGYSRRARLSTTRHFLHSSDD